MRAMTSSSWSTLQRTRAALALGGVGGVDADPRAPRPPRRRLTAPELAQAGAGLCLDGATNPGSGPRRRGGPLTGDLARWRLLMIRATRWPDVPAA
jgi:hypothetical protein